jgi:hypothetical protein
MSHYSSVQILLDRRKWFRSPREQQRLQHQGLWAQLEQLEVAGVLQQSPRPFAAQILIKVLLSSSNTSR